ncbi:MAG: hypothetical protein KDC80_11760, partial [Saprospiraceae bacterium]|nr:hypothetical protein [Saprospiraceae bacterium]
MKQLFVFAMTLMTSWALSQPNPVSWQWSSKHVDGNTFDLIFTATIQSGWNTYSIHMEPGGPVPTSFNFNEDSHYSLGEMKEEGKVKKGYDKLFDQDVIKVYTEATYTQRVEVSDYSKPITGYLEFMTCNEVTCLPPKSIDFSFALQKPGKTPESQTSEAGKINENPASPAATAEENQNAWSSVVGTEELNVNSATGFQKPTSILWNATADVTDNPNEFIININATIDDGWNIYSMFMDEGGPIPTSLIWENEGEEFSRIDFP